MTTKMKLDFRFADEMDGLDIEQFVNEASAVEHTGDMSFRKESPLVTIEEVEADLLSMPIKWLVLETPHPEELVVAAARLKYDKSRSGSVDIFCATGSTEEIRVSVMKRLLSVVESVSYNIGLRCLVLEAAQWRTDLDTLFTSCGYVENSGHMWPENKQHMLTRPTMVLQYHKAFPAQGAAGASSDTGTSDEAQGKGAGIVGMLMPVVAWDEQQYGGPDPASATTATVTITGAVKVAAAPAHVQAEGEVDGLAADLLAATVFTTLSTNSGSAGAGGSIDNVVQQPQQDMPMLMQSLFAALHAEYGDGADPK